MQPSTIITSPLLLHDTECFIKYCDWLIYWLNNVKINSIQFSVHRESNVSNRSYKCYLNEYWATLSLNVLLLKGREFIFHIIVERSWVVGVGHWTQSGRTHPAATGSQTHWKYSRRRGCKHVPCNIDVFNLWHNYNSHSFCDTESARQ